MFHVWNILNCSSIRTCGMWVVSATQLQIIIIINVRLLLESKHTNVLKRRFSDIINQRLKSICTNLCIHNLFSPFHNSVLPLSFSFMSASLSHLSPFKKKVNHMKYKFWEIGHIWNQALLRQFRLSVGGCFITNELNHIGVMWKPSPEGNSWNVCHPSGDIYC